VSAGGYKSESFTVDPNATQIKLQGHFAATGGTGSDIEVYVMTDDGFTWKTGHSLSPLYNSGHVTQDTLNVSLPAGGTYHIIFSNKFSWFSPKAIQLTDAKVTFLLPLVQNMWSILVTTKDYHQSRASL
jgi:hypothetical protein